MIIATIGHHHYKLKDLTAAEHLLKILAEAVPADDHYVPGQGYMYTELVDRQEIKPSIVQGYLLTDEELLNLLAPAVNKD